jgi:hypothetical protein
MRQHQWLNTVVVDGRRWGTFDTFSGGNPARENSKRRHAGQAHRTVYPGVADYDDVTVGVPLDLSVSYDLVRAAITDPNPKRMSVTRQPLNEQLRPDGKPLVYTGWLQTANIGDTDSDADDMTTLEATMTVETVS